MKVNISTEDLNARRILEPTWYPCEIVKVEDKVSKSSDDGSMVTHISFKTLGAFAGVPLRTFVSEKYQAAAVPLLSAISGGGDISEGEYNLDQSIVGKKLDVFVANEQYKGNTQNAVKDFRPLSA